MNVSGSSRDNIFPVQNSVAIPAPIFKHLLSQTATSPLDHLLAVLRWLEQQQISVFTVASGEKRRKPLSAPICDLLAFLVGGCAISTNLIEKICSKFEPFPAGTVYFTVNLKVIYADNMMKFLFDALEGIVYKNNSHIKCLKS